MGLVDVFKQAAVTAVTAFGDVAASAVYAAYASTSYNASTGTVTATYTSTAAVKCILANFSQRQIDNSAVRPTDRLALIPASNIPNVTPGLNDRLRAAGVTYEVVSWAVDPAGALWKIQLRPPKG